MKADGGCALRFEYGDLDRIGNLKTDDDVLTRIIAAPGLWFQRLTVKEPTDKMMEAAIAAMKAVIPENGEDIIR